MEWKPPPRRGGIKSGNVGGIGFYFPVPLRVQIEWEAGMKNLSGGLKGFISEPKLSKTLGNLSPPGGLKSPIDLPERRLANGSQAALGVDTVDAKSPCSGPEEGPEGQLVVGAGVFLKGVIKKCEVLEIRGDVEAEIECDRLVVDEGGQLKGSFVSEIADLGGQFLGTASVKDEVVIRSTGCVAGELSYGSIRIDIGGKVRGKLSDSSDQNVSPATSSVNRTGSFQYNQNNQRSNTTISATPIDDPSQLGASNPTKPRGQQ